MDLSVEASATVLQQLRQYLADRRLKPGDRVPSIRDLTRRFGASVVDVRDALVQAERDGLLEIRPRSESSGGSNAAAYAAAGGQYFISQMLFRPIRRECEHLAT